VAFFLNRCDKFSNGNTVYLAGEDANTFLFDTQEKYKDNSFFDDVRAILLALMKFSKTKMILTDFRTEFDEHGNLVIIEEGGKNMTALYYKTSHTKEDNIFRVYCVWPVLGNEKILIVGGGGLKEQDGPFQDIPELNTENDRLKSLKELLELANYQEKVIVKNNKLYSNTTSLIINN
jgi:hypothetical protein